MEEIFCVKTYFETKSFNIAQARYWKEVQFQYISKQESDFPIGQELSNS